MVGMVYVELFPTQTETDVLLLIVQSKGGVTYLSQVGGTACARREVEGFLVPIGTDQDLRRIGDWFEKRFHGSCHDDGRLAADPALADELESLMFGLACFFTPGGAKGDSVRLSLDHDRIHEACEAWIPVNSPYGKAYLTWTNSD